MIQSVQSVQSVRIIHSYHSVHSYHYVHVDMILFFHFYQNHYLTRYLSRYSFLVLLVDSVLAFTVVVIYIFLYDCNYIRPYPS